jgi:glycosyltransferase involved in cell wall biosynthesis
MCQLYGLFYLGLNVIIKIIIFTPYFVPGFKGGGPIKSVQNIVQHLAGEFEFWIVTHDRDLGDGRPYPNVGINKWNTVKNANVFYASSDRLTFSSLTKIINDTQCDVVYLNSFFNVNFATKILMARRFGLLADIKSIILAPRGEFSSGALQIKSFKKRIFIFLTKLIGLYKNVFWQATSQLERKDIIKVLSVKEESVLLATNLPQKTSELPEPNSSDREPRSSDSILKIVFLSRISPKKNLSYALKVLKKVKVPIRFDIYGPKEDENYWLLCQKLTVMIPSNIHVTYCGSVHPAEVSHVFSNYDLFFLPTQGENYGHVIAESLSVGTPVLISDQTPWRNLHKTGLGWDLPLSGEADYVKAIESYFTLSAEEHVAQRKRVIENSYKRIFNSADIDANRLLFLTASRAL